MEEQMILKEILHALKLHGEHMDKRFDDVKSEMNQRFDHVDKNFDVTREELIDLRETTNFLLSKLIQHDKKLQQLSNQQ